MDQKTCPNVEDPKIANGALIPKGGRKNQERRSRAIPRNAAQRKRAKPARRRRRSPRRAPSLNVVKSAQCTPPTKSAHLVTFVLVRA